jgi:predicted MPP superfamily phosphohydrolase
MPLRIVLIVGLALFMNVGLAILQVSLLRRRKPWPKSIGYAAVLWSVSMILLSMLQLFAPSDWVPFMRRWLYFPMSVEMAWNLVLMIAFPAMILVVLAMGRLRPVKKEAPSSPDDISRRKFLYLATYSAAPALAIGMGVHGSITRNDLRVRPLTIPITGLPPELEGFTIAHVSDLHSGIFVGPERLKIISDTTNDLKADLVTITGDVINREMTEFIPALAAMKAIESRHGTYLCEGNHDQIPGPGIVMDACTENNLPMLAYESVILPIRGQRLILGGLPWMRDGFETHPEIVSQLFPERREGDVRILLAHHPHLFDIADSADLVLTGHTHGGQIMLGEHTGLGPLFFKYWSGLYQRANTSLVVSNGCGDWFPCRICAPAEIALLTLKAA